MALASLAAVSCDRDPLEPAELTSSVDITTLPSGADVTDLPRGVTVQMIAGSTGGGAITFSSSNAAVATVDPSTGLVTTVAGGSTFIIATSGAVADSITVTVQFPVETLTLAADTLEIRREGSVTVEPTLIDTQGDTVEARVITFITLDEAIAMVDDDGVVTGVSDGTARIQVSTEGVVDTIEIVVAGAPLVATVTVEATATFGGIGQTVQAEYTPESAAGNEVPGTTATWSSSNTSVATVSTTGLVTLVGEGTASIRADVDNGDGVNVRGSLTVRGAPILVSGVGQGTGTIASGTPRYWALVVPAGATNISVSTDAGTTGDGDLFLLKRGVNPATPSAGGPSSSAWHCTTNGVCFSAASGNLEAISLSGGNLPPAGTYPISYHAWTGGGFTEDVTGVTITATIAP